MTYAIVFFIVFFVAMILEIMLPTAGVLLIVSLMAAATSLYFAFMTGPWFLLGMLVAYAVSIPSLIWVFKTFWQYSPVGRAVEGMAPESATDPQADSKKMIGKKGVVVNEMRPVGVIEISNKRYSANCKSGLAEVGEVVQIVDVQMNRLFVLPLGKDFQGPAVQEPKTPQAGQASSEAESATQNQGAESLEPNGEAGELDSAPDDISAVKGSEEKRVSEDLPSEQGEAGKKEDRGQKEPERKSDSKRSSLKKFEDFDWE